MEILVKCIDQGGMFAILALGVFFIYRVSWWIAYQLLEPVKHDGTGGGLMVRYFTIHQQFLAGLELLTAKQQETCTRHTELLESLCGWSSRMHSETSDVHTCVEQVRKMLESPVGPQSLLPFNQSAIDLARARLLELQITPETTPQEALEKKERIAALLAAVEERHQAQTRARMAQE